MSTVSLQYPVIGVHGLFGFGDILGIEYWGPVKEAVEAAGVEFYETRMGALASNRNLADELITFLEELKSETGYEKFNLIGHSQGGLVSRIVLAKRPDLCASICTVGSPHFGSAVADLVAQEPITTIAEPIAEALAGMINFLSGNTYTSTDARDALASLTTEGCETFNNLYPYGLREGAYQEPPRQRISPWWKWWDVEYAYDYSVNDGKHEMFGVKLFSMGSYFDPSDHNHTNLLDPLDNVFKLTEGLFGEENDGLVARSSMSFGKVLFDRKVGNHIDQIGLLEILNDSDVEDWPELYVDYCKVLEAEGC